MDPRPASPSFDTFFRTGVQIGVGTGVAEALTRIGTYFVNPPEEISGDVSMVLTWLLATLIAMGTAYLGSKRRYENPGARTLLRTPF